MIALSSRDRSSAIGMTGVWHPRDRMKALGNGNNEGWMKDYEGLWRVEIPLHYDNSLYINELYRVYEWWRVDERIHRHWQLLWLYIIHYYNFLLSLICLNVDLIMDFVFFDYFTIIMPVIIFSCKDNNRHLIFKGHLIYQSFKQK